nr:hypothetical protein [Tanacetum cinerariifolium]
MKRKAVKKMVKKRIAEAIEEYKKTRVNPGNANTGGSMNVQGCTHKTFMNGKPHPFNETKGVVGLRRWIQKVEQVFEICKCAKEDKSMMTTEYCPSTEIQRMEEELWTLTLKGDDIEAYNNRFHELALMCPDLVPNKKNKNERYMKEFPKRIKGNITSSRPTTLHERNHPNNNNKPNNRNYNRNNNNQHHQQNRRQETARSYATAPAKGKAYARTLPK